MPSRSSRSLGRTAREVNAPQGRIRARAADAGTVRFAGDDVTGLRADRLTRRGMNLVPQVENVFPTLTVAENLQIGALVLPRAQRRRRDGPRPRALPAARRAPPSARGLAVGWRAKARRDCASAGGTPAPPAPRRAVRRALAARHRHASSTSLEDSRSGIAIVMVEQNARRALALAEPRVCPRHRPERVRGPGRELLDDPRVVELYLGLDDRRFYPAGARMSRDRIVTPEVTSISLGLVS